MARRPSRKAVAQGRAIFEREWQPGDSRSHGGDGLGPVYNDSSCVACHNQGGTGGAGSTGKNVDIITATPNGQAVSPFAVEMHQKHAASWPGPFGRWSVSSRSPPPRRQTRRRSKRAKPARPKIDTTELVKAHPGFRTARSVVLHRFGTDDNTTVATDLRRVFRGCTRKFRRGRRQYDDGHCSSP